MDNASDGPSPDHIFDVSTNGVAYRIFLPDSETDYIQRDIARSGLPYEEDMLAAMARFFGEDDLIIDVGANVGNHAVFLSTVVGSAVVAFEPDAHLAAAIDTSAALNGVAERLTTHAVALGAAPGRAFLTPGTDGNLGNQYLSDEHTGDAARVEVRRLDEYTLDRPVAGLKIDVEGAELDVLRGARELLQRDHPRIYVECISFDEYLAVESELRAFGYVWESCHNATPTHCFVAAGEFTDQVSIDRFNAAISAFYRTFAIYGNAVDSLREANTLYRNATKRNAELRTELESSRAVSENVSSSAMDHASLEAREQLEQEIIDAREALTAASERRSAAARVAEQQRRRARGARADAQRLRATIKQLTAQRDEDRRQLKEAHTLLTERDTTIESMAAQRDHSQALEQRLRDDVQAVQTENRAAVESRERALSDIRILRTYIESLRVKYAEVRDTGRGASSQQTGSGESHDAVVTELDEMRTQATAEREAGEKARTRLGITEGLVGRLERAAEERNRRLDWARNAFQQERLRAERLATELASVQASRSAGDRQDSDKGAETSAARDIPE